MDSNSPASVADMLLQRHRSSLQPAAAAAATATAAAPAPTAGSATSLEQQRHRIADAPATAVSSVGGTAAAASDAELERMMQAARWGNGAGGGKPQPQLTTAADGRGGDVALPRMREEPLSPVIIPARDARQPDIGRHEAADVYDVLEFRLRNNDRDLHSLLSRSADRLAQSEQQHPHSPAGDLALPSEAPAAQAASYTTPPPATSAGQDRSTAAAHAGADAAATAVAATGSMASPTLPPPPQGIFQEKHVGSRGTPPPVTRAAVVGGAAEEGTRGAGTISPPEKNSASGTDNNSRAAGGGGKGGSHGSGAGGMAGASSGVTANAAAPQAGAGAGMMPAPVSREAAAAAAAVAAVAAGGGLVVTPTRNAGGNAGGGKGAENAAGASSLLRPPRASAGGSSAGAGSAAVTRGALETVNNNRSSSDRGGIIGKDGVLGTPPRLPPQLAENKILEAAREAARWLAIDNTTWHQGKKFMDECTADCPNQRILTKRNMTADQWRESKVNAIKRTIAADPSLATLRHINKSALPMDGWTPLHAAAAKGNLEFIQVLLEVPGVSAWSVDLQGRTPLALAVDGGHLEVSLLLKASMERESADTIVGVNAPVDLAGRTPVAWSVKSQRRNREVEGHLYAAGDASVCPATPAALRSGGGRTGTKGGGAGAGMTGAGRGAAESVGDGLPCGYSDAPGWRIEMEDAVCRHNPIPVVGPEAREAPPPDPTSMFGIFDGHGGAFTSGFCATELIKCLQATPGWKSGDRDLPQLCPAVMEAFVNCDELLASQPRMAVTEKENPSGGKRFEARDGSGSTAVVALVTPAHVIVANAGDSRAVLIMVEPDYCISNSSSSDAKKKAGKQGKGQKTITSGSSSGGGRGSADKKGAAETMAAALGLRLDGTGGGGAEETKGEEAVIDRLAAAAAAAAAVNSPSGEERGLNDSVRLEELEEDGEDGCEFEGADKIRELLESMMLGKGAGEGKGARGEGGDVEEEEGGGGGDGDGSGGVMVTAMSRDHTAMDPAERERVTAAGGKAFEVHYTEADGTPAMVVRTAYDDKVEGQSVMPTRGFGDLYYKQRKGDDGLLLPPALQVVTSCPEIMVHERGSSGKEELLLLACDGVWDVFDDQEAGEFLVSSLDVPLGEVTGEHLALACDALVRECLGKGSTDNITAMAVSLGSGPPPRPSALGGKALFSDGQ